MVRGANPTTNVVEDARAFARRLSLILGGALIGVDVSNIPIEVTSPAGIKKTVVSIPMPSFVLERGATAVIGKTKLVTEHVTRVCGIRSV